MLLFEMVLLFKLVYDGRQGKLFLSAMTHHNNEESALIVWSSHPISGQFSLAMTAEASDLHFRLLICSSSWKTNRNSIPFNVSLLTPLTKCGRTHRMPAALFSAGKTMHNRISCLFLPCKQSLRAPQNMPVSGVGGLWVGMNQLPSWDFTMNFSCWSSPPHPILSYSSCILYLSCSSIKHTFTSSLSFTCSHPLFSSNTYTLPHCPEVQRERNSDVSADRPPPIR